MKRYIVALSAAAVVAAGLFSPLFAQESQGEAEAPRMTPEERRERWREMRDLSAEERRERLEEWRERRRAARAEQESEPLGPPPENYLDQLEFRSIVSLAGVTEFTLRNPYEERTLVISTEKGSNGVEVVEFDAEANSLTVSHEDEVRTLSLQASRVAALDDGESSRSERRERWAGRRERFREFRETWDEAAENSPELREIQSQFRELMGDYRERRSALREAEPGSDEHRKLQEQQQEMREEFRLLSEYSMLEVRQNPAFEGQDVDSLERTIRMMFRQGGERGRWDGRRGRGRR